MKIMKTKTRPIISILLLLAMLGTSYVSNAPAAKATPPTMLAMIQVISPNGGETYSVGQDMEISFINPLSTLTGIRIMNSNGNYYDLEWMGIMNGNKWEENFYSNNLVQKKIWNIPADVVPGKYKVEIKAIDLVFANKTSEAILGGDSSDNYFSIIGRTTSKIKVISPNGGEKWQIGNEYIIQWNTADYTNIKVDLYKGGKFVKNLISANYLAKPEIRSESISSMVWTPDASLVSGDDYKIRVSDYYVGMRIPDYDIWEMTNYDESDNYFSIARGATSNIQVVSPNGGERWQIGNEYIIKWNASDRISSKIDLYKGGRFVKNLLDSNDLARSENKPGMAYSMVWTPNASLIPGGDYKIRVSDTYRNQNIYSNDIWKMPNYDESDNYFSIVETITPPYCFFDRISIPEGAIIQASGEADVYIIKYAGGKAFKRLILNPSVFRSYGHLKWGNIIKVDKCVLDSFTTSNLVRSVRNGKIYSLSPNGDAGVRRIVKNQAVLQRLGLDPVSAYEINETDEVSYDQGQDLE